MTKDIPDVSIIIPLFNCADLFPDCIDSLLEQTFGNIEVIVVDDGSTDGSQIIVEQYANYDNRIKLASSNRLGAGGARNIGFDFARGEYVMFLDADDFFEHTLVESALSCIRLEGADVCVFGANSFDHATGIRRLKRNVCRLDRCSASVFKPQDNATYIFTFTTAAPWTKIYRTAFIRENNLQFQELPNSNDLAFTMIANALASKIAIIDQPLVNYRINRHASTQGQKKKSPLAFYDALIELKARLIKHGVFELYAESFIDMALENCTFNILSLLNDRHAARQVFSYLKTEGFYNLGIRNPRYDELPTCSKRNYLVYRDIMHSRFPSFWLKYRAKSHIKRTKATFRLHAKHDIQ